MTTKTNNVSAMRDQTDRTVLRASNDNDGVNVRVSSLIEPFVLILAKQVAKETLFSSKQ